jgi:hypothetical protein
VYADKAPESVIVRYRSRQTCSKKLAGFRPKSRLLVTWPFKFDDRAATPSAMGR